MSEDITKDKFANCAIWAYYEAMADGKHGDSDYVKKLAYYHYEQELKHETFDR